MITDSVSHSILPGIAAGFLFTGSLTSPFLVVGAFVAAFASVISSEALSRGRLMSNDSAIAFVYPFLFSIGVILVSGYTDNAHLDVDSVLLGEIAFAPLERVVSGGKDLGPFSFYSSGAVVLINTAFIALFYKELKLLTFDPVAAKAAGLSNSALSAFFSAVVCITCIVSFGAVGSVLLIALIAAPPCCALLLTDRLGRALVLSALFAVAASVAGFHLAVAWNTNIAGAVTTVLGAVFLFVLIFAPRKGVVSGMLEKRRRSGEIQTALLLEYLAGGDGSESIEKLCHAMMWKQSSVVKTLRRAEKKGCVETDGRSVRIMASGRNAAGSFALRPR